MDALHPNNYIMCVTENTVSKLPQKLSHSDQNESRFAVAVFNLFYYNSKPFHKTN